MNQAKEVRRFLGERGGANFEQLCQHLDLVGNDERRMLRLTLRDLKKSGEVEEAGGIYHHLRPLSPPGDLQDKFWEACKEENPGFTVGQVVTLAGGTAEYVGRVLRFWRAQGWLEVAGRRPSRKFGRAQAYRIVPGKEKEQPPRWNRRVEKEKKPTGPTIIQRVNGLLAENCTLRGRAGCEGYPQDCERCDLQAGADFPKEMAAFARSMRGSMREFISILQASLAARVEQVLQEMEADLARAAQGGALIEGSDDGAKS
jgi:hypothetical protein